MEAYSILVNSKTELRMIPLSELIAYRDNFGLIGTFKEFVDIIYAVDYAYNKHRVDRESK